MSRINPVIPSYFTEFIIQELNELININSLLNTTKQLKEYKKKYFYWKLNETFSFKYYNDVDYYNHINSKILYGNKQLFININRDHEITDNGLKYLGNCHTLDLSHYVKITDQ